MVLNRRMGIQQQEQPELKVTEVYREIHDHSRKPTHLKINPILATRIYVTPSEIVMELLPSLGWYH